MNESYFFGGDTVNISGSGTDTGIGFGFGSNTGSGSVTIESGMVVDTGGRSLEDIANVSSSGTGTVIVTGDKDMDVDTGDVGGMIRFIWLCLSLDVDVRSSGGLFND